MSLRDLQREREIHEKLQRMRGHMWSWSWWWKPGEGPTKLWIVSLTFIFVGALIAFFVPNIIEPNAPDRDPGILLVRILGGTILFVGVAVFVPMILSLCVKRKSPEDEAVLLWWVNFLAGLLGALAFGIPATLMFPLFLVAYFLRPNFVVAADDPKTTEILLVALLFSVIGVTTLVALFFIGRNKHRERPAWARKV